MEQSAHDYKKLLTEIIQKQMVLLGDAIVLSRVRGTNEIVLTDDGTVTEIQGEPESVIRKVINEFVALSGEIVTKAVEPLFEKSGEAPHIELPAAPIQPEPMTTVSTPSVEPTTPEPTAEMTQPTQQTAVSPMAQLSPDPFPSTQPMPAPMPTATPTMPDQASTAQSTVSAMPTPPAAEASTTSPAPAAPQTPTPASPAQGQTDPDMQHIINEALKQTK